MLYRKELINGKGWIMPTKRQMISLIVNFGLLCSGLVMAFSGLLIQINYHMGNHGDIVKNNRILGINYYSWSDIHKFTIVIITLLMIFHIALHWKWYIAVFKKKLIAKNTQQITLSIVFILVAITGYIPWFIDLLEGDEVLCKIFIEIHDKLAIVFLIYLILHTIKRLKWFFSTFDKLINKHSTHAV